MSDRICAAQDCAKTERLIGQWCRLHYNRVYRTGSPNLQPPKPKPIRACTAPECGRDSTIDRIKNDLCNLHYQRWRSFGRLDKAPPRPYVLCDGPECTKRGGVDNYCPQHRKQLADGISLRPIQTATKDLGRPAYCVFPSCGRPHKARGLCKSHNEQARANRPLTEVKRQNPGGLCSTSGCSQPCLARGLCSKHVGLFYSTTRKYGLTIDQYNGMVAAQDNRCAICGGVNRNGHRLSIDHDHSCCATDSSCGKCVRALLCNSCNIALGLARDDSELLRRMASYVEGYALT